MKKYNVGITVGVFDMFHIGHLNLLEKCKDMCEKLIVAVCDDDYVRNIKNKEPIIEQEDRMRLIGALKCVDNVVLVTPALTEDKMMLHDKHNFDVLFSGDDWKNSERYKRTEREFEKIGVAIEYLPYTKGVSTTDIKNKIIKTFGEENDKSAD